MFRATDNLQQIGLTSIYLTYKSKRKDNPRNCSSVTALRYSSFCIHVSTQLCIARIQCIHVICWQLLLALPAYSTSMHIKKAHTRKYGLCIFGRGREIRTPDILLPKQARYQTALYPVNSLAVASMLRRASGGVLSLFSNCRQLPMTTFPLNLALHSTRKKVSAWTYPVHPA